jgi:hypothetical protein
MLLIREKTGATNSSAFQQLPDKALCVQGEGRRNKTSTGLATGGGDIISV